MHVGGTSQKIISRKRLQKLIGKAKDKSAAFERNGFAQREEPQGYLAAREVYADCITELFSSKAELLY